ncbi:MAG: 2-hydroxyacid dehydrogenase [Pseudomonadota bacterium]
MTDTAPQPAVLYVGGVPPHALDALHQHFRVHTLADIVDRDAFVAEHGATVFGAVTNGHDGFSTDWMDALPALKVISCCGVGYDAIDANAAADRGIMVTHTPNVLNADVANTAIMLMLATSRQLLRDDAWARSGAWAAKGAAPLTRSIEGATVGILGLGRIGESLASKLQAFNCQVHYHTRTRRDHVDYTHHTSAASLAEASDYLVVITPGGASTQHLVNREVLDALGPDGTLINVSRGSVVDEAALVDAITEGRLHMAGLDVFEHEPTIPEALTRSDRVVLLPHVGSATVETRRAMGDLTVDNLLSWRRDGAVLTPVPECAAH